MHPYLAILVVWAILELLLAVWWAVIGLMQP